MKMAWSVYLGTYSDNHGTEPILVFNDGETLEVEIRGIRFSGKDFDGLHPGDDVPASSLEKFVLNKDELCACTIAFDMPQVINNALIGCYTGALHVDLQIGKPAPNGGIDSESLRLTLSYSEWVLNSRGSGGLFESELLDLKRQLPAGHHLVNCFGCAYSDYFYGGQGLFGSMVCFRECKSEYLSVRTKDDYIVVYDKNAGAVQETSICPQFTRREPNTGYRG